MRLNTPDSYWDTCATVSARTSTCTLVSLPVDPPYQSGTGWKSIDWPGTREVKRKGPLPISVSGLVNHAFSPADATTFWSTNQKGHRPTSVVKYPARLVSVAVKVKSSVLASPLIWLARPVATAS